MSKKERIKMMKNTLEKWQHNRIKALEKERTIKKNNFIKLLIICQEAVINR